MSSHMAKVMLERILNFLQNLVKTKSIICFRYKNRKWLFGLYAPVLFHSQQKRTHPADSKNMLFSLFFFIVVLLM